MNSLERLIMGEDDDILSQGEGEEWDLEGEDCQHSQSSIFGNKSQLPVLKTLVKSLHVAKNLHGYIKNLWGLDMLDTIWSKIILEKLNFLSVARQMTATAMLLLNCSQAVFLGLKQ
ncbi:hypothetical protein Tco_0005571 [Tanacetum coccineum]